MRKHSMEECYQNFVSEDSTSQDAFYEISIKLMGRVEGKVAIITGAASGLGYAAAVKLMVKALKSCSQTLMRKCMSTMPERLSRISVRHNLVHLFMMLQTSRLGSI